MVELLAAKTQAGESIAQRLTTAQTLYAPYILDGEVISALLGLLRGRKIIDQEAEAALANYRAFPIERQDVLSLWPRVKSLRANLSAYDAQYVALAEALRVPLVTADARIGRSGAARCDIEVFGEIAGLRYPVPGDRNGLVQAETGIFSGTRPRPGGRAAEVRFQRNQAGRHRLRDVPR